MKTLLEYLDRIPKTLISVIGVAMVILLGVIDHQIGYEISFSIFYMLPVFFVSWFGTGNQGTVIAFFSAATWLLADLSSGHTYSHFAIPIWNCIMRLGIFLMGVFFLSTIKTLLEREQSFARTDSLTGVNNGRHFNEIATAEISRLARFGHPFTIAYIDIDNFKQVNDTLGHSHGDKLLQAVAKTIKDSIRSTDMVSRLGGDEFAVLFPETNEKNAQTALSKMQRELLVIVNNSRWSVTFSIGAVTCYKPCGLDELIKEADNLMYSVKKSGKNRIEFKIHG